MRITNPQILYLLFLLIPIWYLLFTKYIHINKLLLQIYTSDYIKNAKLGKVLLLKIFFLSVLFILIVFSFSKLQIIRLTTQLETEERSTVVIAIDVSRSMYVEEQEHTRIEKIIDYILKFIDTHNDSQYLVYAFTDRVAQIVPLTDDTIYVKNILSSLKHRPIITGSSDFTRVIKILNDTYINDLYEKNDGVFTFMFASDGESHTHTSPNILFSFSNKKINTFILFAGTEEGGLVPSDIGYVIDKNGIAVMSYANSILMQTIADNAKGLFIDINSENKDSISVLNNTREYPDDVSWMLFIIASMAMCGYIISILL